MSKPSRIRARVDHQEGVRAYPNAAADSLAGKSAYIDYGTDVIDPARYRDPLESEREWEKMWTKIWTLAGYACDIPAAGDWFRYELGRESFIVVRNDDNSIRAFYNVCPHRGNRIVHADFGTTGECFHCTFHGWEYAKNGRLLRIKEAETFRPEVVAAAPGLTEVKCDVWAGLVFVSMNPDVEPLRQFLGILPDHLDRYHIEQMRPFEDVEYVLDANWKTSTDAFLEFYHADQVHPEVGEVMETYWCQYDLYARGHSRMIIPYGYHPDKVAGREQVKESLRAGLRQYQGDPEQWHHLDGTQYKTAFIHTKRRLAEKSGWTHFQLLTDDQVVDDWNYSIFPNVTFNILGETCLVQSWRPHPRDPMRTIYRSTNLSLVAKNKDFRPISASSFTQLQFGPEGWDGSSRPAILRARTAAETGFVLAQDCELIPPVQSGINSRSFKGSRLGEQEIRIRHYLAELDRYLAL